MNEKEATEKVEKNLSHFVAFVQCQVVLVILIYSKDFFVSFFAEFSRKKEKLIKLNYGRF